MALTVTQVSKARPHQKPYKLTDAGGMYLHVFPNGSKYWRLKYRLHGKEKTFAIGVYPKVTLSEARSIRDDAKKNIAAGNDPVLKRHQDKQQKQFNSENTFEAIATEWHEQLREQWTPHHAVDVLNSLKREVFPALGKRSVVDITTQEVLTVIRKVENRGALDVAGRILQRTASVFRYAVQTGRLQTNPATELRGVVKQRKVKHQPSLKAEELPEFLNKLDGYDGEPLTRLALKLLILTFVRPGELKYAEWNEFNFKDKIWTIPGPRMKMKAEHLVPLSRQAITTLEEIRQFSGGRMYVFPSRNREGKVMSENTMTYALYRLGYHSRAVPHGFRSTASTILNEQGWRPDVIERQLAHAEKNAVRAAYHRSEYLTDRIKMMQRWADYLDRVKAGAEIIQLKRPQR